MLYRPHRSLVLLLLLILFGNWVAVIVTSGPDQGATLFAGGGRNVVENMGVNRPLTCAQTKRKFNFKNTVDPSSETSISVNSCIISAVKGHQAFLSTNLYGMGVFGFEVCLTWRRLDTENS